MGRIAIVWLTTLVITSATYGGFAGDGFLIVFVTYGLFMSIPAVAVLFFAGFIERLVLTHSKILASLSGMAVGCMVPGILYLIAPNKQNAIMGIEMLVPILAIAVLLWTASFYYIHRRQAVA